MNILIVLFLKYSFEKINEQAAIISEETSNCAYGYHCSNCLVSDNTLCTSCDYRYGFELDAEGNHNNKCIQCSDKACFNCEADYTHCTNCISGFILSENGICELCPVNCNYCNGLECNGCKTGFQMVNKECIECPLNCARCNEGNCIECNDGYGLKNDENKNTKVCVPCDDLNCQKCGSNSAKCTQCKDGFGKNITDGTCSRCLDGCSDCISNYLNCNTCEDGYGFEIVNSEKTGKCKKCPDNCDVKSCSDDASKCTLCQPHYGPIIDNDGNPTGKCGKCPEYCFNCSIDSTKCIQCDSNAGFILNDNGLSTEKCALCPGDCNCADDASKCSCPDGYGNLLDKNGNPTGLCSPCPPNCENCLNNADKCTKCEMNTGPVLDKNGENTGKCQKCVGLCNNCDEDYTKCSDCNIDSYYIHIGPDLDENEKFTGKCILCGPNCKSCTKNAKVCEECDDSFILQNGKCVSCPILCDRCDDPSFCLECESEYGPILDKNGEKTGQCGGCPKKCRKCENDHNICTECQETYGLYFNDKGDSEGICVKCLDENCVKCNDYRVCDRCDYGYSLNSENKCVITPSGDTSDGCYYRYGPVIGENGKPTGECRPCGKNCSSCSTNYLICTTCAEYTGMGFVIVNGKQTADCDYCTQENCHSCRNNNNFCEQCKDHFGWKDGVEYTECSPCPDNCSNCLSDSSRCSATYYCDDGFGLDENGKCIKCPNNCEKCASPSFCDTCQIGFGVDRSRSSSNYGKCITCKDQNCESCNFDYTICTSCNPSYGLTGSENDVDNPIKCEKCPNHCKDCSYDISKCSICEDGYGFEIDSNGEQTRNCILCGSHCINCQANANICSSCENGYGHILSSNGKLSNGCQKCADGCLSCTSDASKCDDCKEGYGMVLNQNGEFTGECKPCPENCLYCNNDYTVCSKCNPYFGVVTHEHGNKKVGQCEHCSQYCQDCTYDSTFCIICDEESYKSEDGAGYVIDANGYYAGTCKACPSNCDECLDSSKCDDCFDRYGYIKNSDGSITQTCAPCPENCRYCIEDNTFCTECLDGYTTTRDNNGYPTGKCTKCQVENCKKCDISIDICEECLYGFYMEAVNGQTTKRCVQCTPNCMSCESATACEYCYDGYYKNDGKCLQCPINCLSCNSKDYCNYCENGYNNLDGQCIKCSENCDQCYNSYCTKCKDGYGFIFENNENTNKCGPCVANCLVCTDNNAECMYCKDDYCYDDTSSSPTYKQCIPCSVKDGENTPCSVEGCLLCKPGKSDQCEICNSNLEIDQNFKCVKAVDVLVSPTPEPIVIDADYSQVNANGYYEPDFDSQKPTSDDQAIVVKIDKSQNEGKNIIQNINIVNKNNRNVAINIKGYSELTIEVDSDTKNKEFDIITQEARTIKVNLEPSTRASIKNGQGRLEITSTDTDKSVNIKQVQPTSSLEITPNSDVTIQEVQFSGRNGELSINSDGTKKVNVNSVKIQQGGTGSIKSAKITGPITIALSSSLEINENVDLTSSEIDFAYNDEHTRLPKDGGQIQGKIASTPKKIVINIRKEGQWLDEQRLLLAESFQQFNCEDWGKIIQYNGPFNSFVCEQDTDTGKYNLYAIHKDDDNKGDKLSPGAIAGIVIAVVVVVGVVVFLLVFFLVIKKKQNQSSGQEAEEV